MTIQVDLKARTVTCSVRDLARDPFGHKPLPALLLQARARLGTEAHATYRAAREGQFAREPAPGETVFAAEVPIRSEREVDGFAVLVRGRIDGLLIGYDGEGYRSSVHVEEVKSVFHPAAEALSSELPAFRFQAAAYALFLAESGEFAHVGCRLVLVSLVSGAMREHEVALHVDRTQDEIVERVRQWIAFAEAEERTRLRRKSLAAKVKMPFESVREAQVAMDVAIREGFERRVPVLINAPTGTGKTAGAMVPALRYALQAGSQLVVLTAKTTQQRLLAETFESLCAASGITRGALHATTIRAKERMCATGTLTCHPEACGYLNDFERKVERTGVYERLRQEAHATPEAIFERGRAAQVCPFYLNLELAQAGDVVFCDYNYVFDPRVRLEQFAGDDGGDGVRGGEGGGGALGEGVGPVVVVDEAHNLVERARGYWSPFLRLDDVRALYDEVRSGGLLAGRERDDLRQRRFEAFDSAVEAEPLLRDLSAWLEVVEASVAAAFGEAVEVLEGKTTTALPVAALQRLAGKSERLLLRYVLFVRARDGHTVRDPFVEFVREFVWFATLAGEQKASLVTYAANREAGEGAGLGILCVDASQRIAERIRECRAVVLMSATLTPMDAYLQGLGLKELSPRTLTLSSPFAREHRVIAVDASVDATFKKRGESTGRIAEIVSGLCGLAPQNIAVYFPSYAFLNAVAGELAVEGYEVVKQSASADPRSRMRVIERLKAFAAGANATPVLLLAALGGSFGEGIDLPGDELSGVVIVSAGLPTVGFEREAIRAYFETETGSGFSQAYLVPGMQRVVQAAGRLIRTHEDRGFVVLLDKRFRYENYAKCMPEGWFYSSVEELLTDDPVALVREALRGWGRLA